jgi:hypothetical protein
MDQCVQEIASLGSLQCRGELLRTEVVHPAPLFETASVHREQHRHARLPKCTRPARRALTSGAEHKTTNNSASRSGGCATLAVQVAELGNDMTLQKSAASFLREAVASDQLISNEFDTSAPQPRAKLLPASSLWDSGYGYRYGTMLECAFKRVELEVITAADRGEITSKQECRLLQQLAAADSLHDCARSSRVGNAERMAVVAALRRVRLELSRANAAEKA